MLGILKAGGAYAPLDPHEPPARWKSMLADLETPVLVTLGALVNRLSADDLRTIRLDDDWPLIAREPGENFSTAVPADGLACVMFTSGSTGGPKGVAVLHQGITRLVRATNYATFSEDDVFFQLAPLQFDASTFEIWGALLNGAELVIAPPHGLTPDELSACLRRHGITTLWLTAGLFQLMVDTQLDALIAVPQLLAGGDVLSPSHVRKFLEASPAGVLINGYGPTENTTFTCCHRMTVPPAPGASVPIGRPIANTEVYVLDEFLQPVPIGVPGELCCGGAGVARGYLKRPELTQEKFIANPLPEAPSPRLYRTGDLVRWRPDGNLEFLGRRDQQVKLRGFRIELGEIESLLQAAGGVRECVVVAREDQPGDKRLVAYLVPLDRQAVPAEAQLRHFLQQQLPEYMIPAHFEILSALPLTPNGKVDRRALPVPQRARDPVGRERVPAGTLTEELLVQIWREVLHVEAIGVEDNFFDLGGHSLLATQVISRIARSLHVELTLRDLFQMPTIAQLAQCLAKEQWSAPSAEMLAGTKYVVI
jgi:amino acid adenylation domain-containing protein